MSIQDDVERCELTEALDLLSDDAKLKKNLCSIPTFKSLAVGGSLAYKGESTNDVDLIPQFSKKFMEYDHEEQAILLGRVADALPKHIRKLPVDLTFFEIVDEDGFLHKYGMTEVEVEPLIQFYDYASELPDEIVMRKDQNTIENIEVLRCQR